MLGLIHHTDGVEGTHKRMLAANKVVQDYAIATECGMGRRPPETIQELLRIHKRGRGTRRLTAVPLASEAAFRARDGYV